MFNLIATCNPCTHRHLQAFKEEYARNPQLALKLLAGSNDRFLRSLSVIGAQHLDLSAEDGADKPASVTVFEDVVDHYAARVLRGRKAGGPWSAEARVFFMQAHRAGGAAVLRRLEEVFLTPLASSVYSWGTSCGDFRPYLDACNFQQASSILEALGAPAGMDAVIAHDETPLLSKLDNVATDTGCLLRGPAGIADISFATTADAVAFVTTKPTAPADKLLVFKFVPNDPAYPPVPLAAFPMGGAALPDELERARPALMELVAQVTNECKKHSRLCGVSGKSCDGAAVSGRGVCQQCAPGVFGARGRRRRPERRSGRADCCDRRRAASLCDARV